MRATVSPSLGYCIIDGPDNNPQLFSAITMKQLDPMIERDSLSLAEDWQVVERENKNDIILYTKKESMSNMCISLCRLAITLPTKELNEWLFTEIESLTSEYCPPNSILQSLLIAPIKDVFKLQKCSDFCLSNGFAVSGSIFNKLYNFQPLISRLSNLWIELDDNLFINSKSTKMEWWKFLFDSEHLIQILEAPNGKSLKNVFGNISFEINNTKDRALIATIGNNLSESLYGSEVIEIAAEYYPDDAPNYVDDHPDKFQRQDRRKEFNRALHEVDAILSSISKGDDYHAERYLDDLIARQTKDSNNIEHAIKSLCNIAKNCADMFRTDFELKCLEKTQQIDSTDSWTMIQISDHLKRRGNYSEARNEALKAISYGCGSVGESLLADITSQEGNYSEAISLYKKISGWENDVLIRTAIADNYRRLGDFEKAQSEYDYVESKDPTSIRAQSGKAEILKQNGKVDQAIAIYKKIINSSELEQRDNWLYRLTYAGLLKQSGDLNQAQIETEEVISDTPFLMQARVMQSSIYGLLDDETKGLGNLPLEKSNHDISAFGEWKSEYTRGLLLLRTERYKNAQTKLVDILKNKLLHTEERAILRVAAALSYLAENNVDDAKSIINSNEEISDAYVKYLVMIFNYHIATLENNNASADKLFAELESAKIINLFSAVQAIKNGDIGQAIRLEIDAVLRIAA